VTCLPLPDEDEKLTPEETKKLYKQLRKHGIPKKAAQKTVKIYEKE